MHHRSPTAVSSPAPPTADAAAMAPAVGGIEPAVTLDQVPRWSDPDQRLSSSSPTAAGSEPPASSFISFSDPLIGDEAAAGAGGRGASRFPVDHEINSKIYLWRGHPWNLQVDAVVNSTNEVRIRTWTKLIAVLGFTLLQGQVSPRSVPPWKVIHTVGPKYAVKYHTAAENALSHCYRSCLELLIENGLESIATGCIYTEAKNYPREPAAHVAIRTVRRFLEKQKDKITAIVFCTTSPSDTEIYKRLLPLYFPRDKHEEEIAALKLPADVGDENGETVIDERKIRIKPLPAGATEMPIPTLADIPLPDSELTSRRRNSFKLDSYLDPAFMSIIKDPDLRRQEQWEKSAQANKGFNLANLLGFGDLGSPPLSAAEEYSLHSRYLAKANSMNLADIAEMKIMYALLINYSYRGGVDSEGRPVMVVVGAHFLLRCLDIERFVLYVVKEFEPLIQKPYTIVYFHSAASLKVSGRKSSVLTDLCSCSDMYHVNN
ncbi:hypothetical protein PR202_gb18615 [Eleusine coracana subsp. coracana]|uniref:Macro domain-containing protein n=1 Tax=Eleusine coracana subsp. coracana TaxID=191504 RepID=A0AAV5F5U7_ELECO|nr:hypothetical protein PR202_gb18615 [Eleusine coracana subsp. coracana]